MKRIYLSILFILIAGFNGCKERTDTAVSGSSVVLAADPYLELIQQEVEQFMSLYPNVKMEVRGATTREAIVHLLNDSVRSIVIDRLLNDEEQQVARQASIRIVQNKIAEDGVAVIVHKKNPISHMTVELVKNIISGMTELWNQVPGGQLQGPIEFVITGRNSGMYELLQNKFFTISKLRVPTAVMNNQRDVIRYVSTHPHSVGFVASSLVMEEKEDVNIVPILVKSPEGGEKEYYPGQQEIYSSLYPFHYSLYLYNAESKAAVGVGFSALVLSNVGQKIIQKAGMVPAAIPYRTIQLHAE